MKRSRAAWHWSLVAAIATAIACEKPDAAPAANPGGATTPAPELTVTGEWPAALGPILVVPSDTETQALVLYPVGAELSATVPRLGLFGPGGDTVRAQTGISASDSLHCGDAAVVRLTRGAPATWSVGIASSAARPLRADSLDALDASDSAFVASELARLASAVPSVDRARFAGIPFTVSTLRRTSVRGREIVAAQLARRLNQEADPGEEHTLLIAEREGIAHGAQFETVHAERSEGTEETAEHYELAGVLRVPGATLFIVVREKPAATTTEILERSDTGEWRVRWTRTVAC